MFFEPFAWQSASLLPQETGGQAQSALIGLSGISGSTPAVIIFIATVRLTVIDKVFNVAQVIQRVAFAIVSVPISLATGRLFDVVRQDIGIVLAAARADRSTFARACRIAIARQFISAIGAHGVAATVRIVTRAQSVNVLSANFFREV